MVTITRKLTKLPDELIIPSYTPYPNFKQTVHRRYCNECGCYISLYDTHHDENFCLKCGEVLDERLTNNNNVPYGSYDYEQPYTGTGYTYSERQYFKSKHKPAPKTFKSFKERKHIEYRNIIEGFKHDLCLDKIDIEDIFIIINTCGGISNVLRGTPAKEVLIGIARYILIFKGIRGFLIHFNNPIYKEYGLNRRHYERMVRNIEKITRRYKCDQ